MRKRNPELSDVSKRLAMQWIKCNSDCSLAVRRLFPWVHLSHGATSTRFSMRVRAVGLGFPRSPQRKLLRASNVGGCPPTQSPVQSRVERTGAMPAPRQWERYGAYLSRRSLSLCWSLNQHPVSLNVKTARSWRGTVPFTHPSREGRMTVTIGRRELL